jgi:ribosomal protein S18 acetylase RimI-like enzyme
VATNGDGRVLGAVAYRLHAGRLHLLTLAVRAGCRRRGVGSLLVKKLREKLATHRRNRVTAVVRESELGACLFLKATGWKATNLVPGYFDGVEDGYLFELREGE